MKTPLLVRLGAVTALAFASAGVGVAGIHLSLQALPTDSLQTLEREGLRRRELDRVADEILAHLAARMEVAEDLAAGRLTPREALERFSALTETRRKAVSRFPFAHRESERDRAFAYLIDCVRYALRHQPDRGAAVLQRLNRELR